MKARWKYLLSVALWSLGLLLIPSSIQAQTKLGVVWQPESIQKNTSNQLSTFSDYSVGLIILDHPVSDNVLFELENTGIPYLINSGFEYYTATRFVENKSIVLEKVKNIHQRYSSSPTFSGLVLFNNSQSYSDTFEALEKDFILESGLKDSLKFFQIFNHDLLQINSNHPVAQLLQTDRIEKASIHEFVQGIQTSNNYLIVKDTWLLGISSQFPSFSNAISNASDLTSAHIPLPALEDSSAPFQWAILLILLLWISVAINIMLNATYQSTILRYFVAHRFFVDDVLSYRHRSSISAVYLLFQHALFGGLVTYFLAKVYLSETGLNALYDLAPILSIAGHSYLSLFFISVIIILLIELIAILWIYIPNPGLVHFNQAMNIFTWIFHLDFIVVTIMGVLFIAQAPHYYLLFLAITYLVTWYASFNISVIGTSKRLSLARGRYLIKTIFLHTVLSVLALVLLFTYNYWMEILNLAIRA